MSTAPNPAARAGLLRGGVKITLLVILLSVIGGVFVGRFAFDFSGSGYPGSFWNWFLDRSPIFNVLALTVAGFVGGQLQYRRGRRDQAAGKEWPIGQFLR